MADSRAARQPRQSEFDTVTFTQPPPKRASEPTMPVDLLIPDRRGEEQAVIAETPEVEAPVSKVLARASKRKLPPAPSNVSEEASEPPKGKISVMLPVEMIERLKDVAFWERTTVAALVEEGLNMALAAKERNHGGPYERRTGELKTGRPVSGPRKR